jgi:hypothetical protein
VIYDSLSNSPILLEGGTGLFPIECIYGFVEVKSVLDRPGIDGATRAIGTVRGFAEEKRYVAYGLQDDDAGNKVAAEFELIDTLPPRSFVFAINSTYSDIHSVVTSLKESTEQNRAHVHGLAVMDKDWFIRQKPTFSSPHHEFVCNEGQSFAAFCATVLDTIQSITVRPASMKRYLGLRK